MMTPKVNKLFKIPKLQHPSDVFMKVNMLLKKYMVLMMLEAFLLISLKKYSSKAAGVNRV